MPKKILLIGAGSSIHITSLMQAYKNVGAFKDCSFDFISTHKSNSEPFANKQYFKKYFYFAIHSWWRKKQLPGLQYIFFIEFLLWFYITRCGRSYDSIQIHGVLVHQYYKTIKILRKITDSIFAIFWGTDINNLPEKHYRKMNKIVSFCDYINFGTPQLKESILKVSPEICSQKKITFCRFGLSFLSVINDSFLLSPSLLYNKIALDYEKYRNKTIVTIGYNAYDNQQHISVLTSIKNFVSNSSCLLLLPLTYGANEKYMSEIEDFLIAYPCEVKLFKKFMASEEVAALRCITDVFIQVQKSDALSGATQEHIYAGSTVITGSWLPYQLLDDAGCIMHKVSNVSDIGTLLLNENINMSDEQKEINKNAIASLSSWDIQIKGWIKMLQYEGGF